MKNIDVVKAFQALGRLEPQQMSIQLSYKLLRLQRKLQPIYELYLDMETKLIDKYHLYDHIVGNQIKFDLDEAGQEVAKEYRKEHTELEQMEADIPEIKPISIQEDIKLSISDLRALEKFIEMPELKEDEDA